MIGELKGGVVRLCNERNTCCERGEDMLLESVLLSVDY